MPDNGTYDVAVLPGSQEGQGKVSIATKSPFISSYLYVHRKAE